MFLSKISLRSNNMSEGKQEDSCVVVEIVKSGFWHRQILPISDSTSLNYYIQKLLFKKSQIMRFEG